MMTPTYKAEPDHAGTSSTMSSMPLNLAKSRERITLLAGADFLYSHDQRNILITFDEAAGLRPFLCKTQGSDMQWDGTLEQLGSTVVMSVTGIIVFSVPEYAIAANLTALQRTRF